ncbi:hypothetical protein Are01nite_77590 [Actinoplanes regularis]|nr:hypothetical protein Are01nite_77590 [Actinoplanes regularis]
MEPGVRISGLPGPGSDAAGTKRLLSRGSPLRVEFGEALAEPAGVGSGQCTGYDVQGAPEFSWVRAALDDAAAVCGIEKPVGRVVEELAPGAQGLVRGSWP